MAGDLDYVNPSTMAAPGGHYSHAVTAAGFVFVSGQLPIAPDGSKLAEASFEQQAQQVLDNVANALKAAGSSIDKLAQVRVYITDIALWPTFNTIYAKWAGSARPARCVVPVPQHNGKRAFVLLTVIVQAFVQKLFTGIKVLGCYQFRVTRNSDLFVDEEEIDDLRRALPDCCTARTTQKSRRPRG